MEPLLVMKEMCDKDMDIRMSSTVVSAQKVKQGATVTMGCEEKVINDIASGEYMTVLFLINKKQYEELSKSNV